MALLHMLVAYGFRRLVVCHLDHRLRGRSSTADAAFVAGEARALGLACEVGRADVRARMEDGGGSMETAAREARLAFFRDCALRQRCCRLLLAHHAEDQAETVLWNLLRGSHGLKGMRPQRRMRVEGVVLEVERPLLGWRRDDLREWLVARGLRWREDASNAEPLGVRNRLRLEALPLLARIAGRDPAVAIARALEGMRDLEEIRDWALGQVCCEDPQGRLHVPALRALPEAVRGAALAGYLERSGVGGVDRALLRRCLGLLEAGAAPAVNLPGGRVMRRRAGRLWVEGGLIR